MTNWARAGVTGLAIAGALLPIGQARAQELPREVARYTLPAQPLADALRAVALQAGRNLVVADELVAGRRAPPLEGMLTAEAAVARLLAGTGLRWRTLGSTIIIEAADGPAEPMPVASAGPSADADDEVTQTIVVTGTNLRGAQPTSPVIALGRRDIERSAPASVEELVRKLPQNVATGVGQENFGVTGAGADITDHGAGINLRGLGQRATLTLLNGRRLAPSGSGSFVDVSLIPISAVERVEIVTDGASAIYGSDAVGGVVNFILRRDFRGVEAFGQVGTTTRGGGTQLLAGATAGRQWSGGQGLLSYEYRHENEIRAEDRSFTIGLPDDWFLFPRERRHSLFASVGQELGAGFRVEVDGFAARRRTQRSFVQGFGSALTQGKAVGLNTGLNAALVWAAGGSWQAELSGGWSRTRNTQVQREVVSGDLFNRYNTLNRVADLNLKLTGDLLKLPGGDVKLALGGQLRWEKFSDLFESSVNPPSPTAGRRSVQSAYGELLIPVVGADNRSPGLERLLLTGAARLDRYSAYGTSIDPKLGILWSPVRELDLRSSYATSFRAPLLSETLGFYNAFLFPAALLFQQPSSAPAGVGAVLVGNDPDVRPETSRSWTIGADWRPSTVPGLSTSLTYYDVRFDNRIALATRSVIGVIGDPGLEPIVTRFPDLAFTSDLLAGAGQLLDFSGPGFTNGGATPADVVAILDARMSNTAASRTRGLDLLARYTFVVGAHRLRTDININRVFAFTDRLTEASPLIDTLNSPFGPIKWRGRASVGWSRGPTSADLFLNYVGSYRDRRAGVDRPVRSWTTVDLTLAYDWRQVSRGLPVRLGLAVQNLLDVKPPRLMPEPGVTRDSGYDPVNASGRGRSLSLQVRTQW